MTQGNLFYIVFESKLAIRTFRTMCCLFVYLLCFNIHAIETTKIAFELIFLSNDKNINVLLFYIVFHEDVFHF